MLPMETCTVGERVTVKRTCSWCLKPASVEVDRTKFDRWIAGDNVQVVWPEMSPEEREMLISGTHPACWDSMFSDDQDWS